MKKNEGTLKEELKEKYFNSLFYRYIGSALAHPKKFFFCLKYPFMKSRNVWSGKFIGYDITWYDMLMTGWQKGFGKKMLKDIVIAFKAHNIPKRKWSKEISWQDIKEKWGELCLYASAPDYIQDILSHYETISSQYCCVCGKPATFWSKGWICPYCEECKLKEEKNGHRFEEMKNEK